MDHAGSSYYVVKNTSIKNNYSIYTYLLSHRVWAKEASGNAKTCIYHLPPWPKLDDSRGIFNDFKVIVLDKQKNRLTLDFMSQNLSLC